MRVFTYFETIPGIAPDLEMLRLWQRSWERNGWEPVIYNRVHALAANKELCRTFLASRELVRGPLPEGYNMACHLRWIAHLPNGGLMVDLDVINNGFTPADMQRMIELYDNHKPILLSGGLCPCAVYATPAGAREMLCCIVDHAAEVDCGLREIADFDGELSFVVHDQAIFARHPDVFKFANIPVVGEYVGETWKHFPLVHFNNRNVPKDRPAAVRASGILDWP